MACSVLGGSPFKLSKPSMIIALPRETIMPMNPHPSAPQIAEARATRQAMFEKGTSSQISQVKSVQTG